MKYLQLGEVSTASLQEAVKCTTAHWSVRSQFAVQLPVKGKVIPVLSTSNSQLADKLQEDLSGAAKTFCLAVPPFSDRRIPARSIGHQTKLNRVFSGRNTAQR